MKRKKNHFVSFWHFNLTRDEVKWEFHSQWYNCPGIFALFSLPPMIVVNFNTCPVLSCLLLFNGKRPRLADRVASTYDFASIYLIWWPNTFNYVMLGVIYSLSVSKTFELSNQSFNLLRVDWLTVILASLKVLDQMITIVNYYSQFNHLIVNWLICTK